VLQRADLRDFKLPVWHAKGMQESKLFQVFAQSALRASQRFSRHVDWRALAPLGDNRTYLGGTVVAR
jgi:hypothetical protein